MTPEPCVLLVRADRQSMYEVLQYNREIGKLVVRSQYGIEMAITTERAEKNGYTAMRGTKMQDPKVEGRVRYVV